MTDTANPSNYDAIIGRQQKRISQLRADLAHYNSKLRQLRLRASDSHQAAFAAATAAAAAAAAAAHSHANPNDFARVHAAHMQAAMYMAAPMPPHPAVAAAAAAAAATGGAAGGGAGNATLGVAGTVPHVAGVGDGIGRGGDVVPTCFGSAQVPQMVHEMGGGALNVAGGGPALAPVPQIQRRQGQGIGKGSGGRGKGCGGEEDDRAGKTRYWTEMEHNQFLYAVKLFGPKNYVAISQYVATRTPKQVRTHAQKYQMRLEREAKKRRAQAAAAAAAAAAALPAVTERGEEVEKSVSTSPMEDAEVGLLSEGVCSPVSDEDDVKGGMKKNSSLGNLADYDDFMRRITGASQVAKTESEMFSESNELDMDILDGHSKTEQFDDSLLADI